MLCILFHEVHGSHNFIYGCQFINFCLVDPVFFWPQIELLRTSVPLIHPASLQEHLWSVCEVKVFVLDSKDTNLLNFFSFEVENSKF